MKCMFPLCLFMCGSPSIATVEKVIDHLPSVILKTNIIFHGAE
jgi:hypothetical protein